VENQEIKGAEEIKKSSPQALQKLTVSNGGNS